MCRGSTRDPRGHHSRPARRLSGRWYPPWLLGAISILRDEHADNSEHFQILTEEVVNRAARTGGTFLHTSRTNPSAVKKEEVPEALRATFSQDKNVSLLKSSRTWIGSALTI